MDVDKLFDTIIGGYHDGALLDALYQDGKLYMQCFRNPPDPDHKEDPNYRYVVMRFDNVTDLQFFDWDSRKFAPYKEGDFTKEEGYDTITGTNSLDYEDGYVIFEECIKFRADDVELLDHSDDELDFEKYIK